MSWYDESWKDSYDAWKLATPPEYDGPDEEEEPYFEDEYLCALEEDLAWQIAIEAGAMELVV